jgi:general secretion pathway protein J
MYSKKQLGFTLIELMVAILIFAIISIISYRTLTSLVSTKQIVTATQDKWNSLVNTITWLEASCNRILPLVIRDDSGAIMPAVIGKNKLNNQFDAQLEITLSGYIGDPIYGSTAPKRLGFRFDDGKLFLVTWPVLNRVISTQPQLDLLVDNVKSFQQSFLYPDKQWRDIWPDAGIPVNKLPQGIRVTIIMNNNESIVRQWAL